MKKIEELPRSKWFAPVVWTLRVLVGAVFVMSGLVKGIDLWGFVFKIEEYLAVWGITQPRSIVVMAAMIICGYEFVFGVLLATGCYKRVSVWALTAMMAVMLPLTFYIMVADPVSDCGCFGDFWVISNTATFLKNLVIMAALIFLCIFNSRLRRGIFRPAIQWMVGAWISLYIIVISLYGYNVQPMVDFRPYPIGAPLIDAEVEDAEDDEDVTFVYERDGISREFSIDNLPDSTWTFVDRKVRGDGASARSALAIYDQDGEDVTEEAIRQEGREILLVIPEPKRIDISYTYFLNDLKQWADSSDVKMVCLIASDEKGIEWWRDISMADYDIYSVEDTKLKEISRGTMSLVELADGKVKSKYTLSSIGFASLDAGPHVADFLERMAPRGEWWFKVLSGFFAACLLVLYLFQNMILAVSSRIRRMYRKKSVNLQSKGEDADIPSEGR